jgi:Flp pilus assembly pilin Flp
MMWVDSSRLQVVRRRKDAVARVVSRLIRDEGGQDIVEYAFLAAFFGIVGYLVLNQISEAVYTTYSNWTDPTAGVPSLWDPPAPAGS